ncbi:hypothetical protein LCGC14_1151920 [marine sediment metagenome]|uniref:DNA methylase N-4/N-6 domain-containing protein n=1 Tax=marine sediment metagenome TaxID=412755 RepID=A0A0F9MIE8_9ZZZZ
MDLINQVLLGDNLKILKSLPDNYIDLIYIDPPFFTGKNYNIIKNGYKTKAYNDKWKGGIDHYISWIKSKIEQIYRVLKSTGTFYLHCDWHINAYLRVICDKIFGNKNFREELIWYYIKGMGSQNIKKKFTKAHNTIFRYSKSDNFTFNMQYYEDLTKRMKKIIKIGYNAYTWKNKKYLYYYGTKAIGKFEESKYDIIKHIDLKNYKKKYTDVLLFNYVKHQSKENLGYPTQKPEKLLECLIKTSSNKGDIVADFFCGCGTTLFVAKKLNRNYIGCDNNHEAIKITKNRLRQINRTKSGVLGWL